MSEQENLQAAERWIKAVDAHDFGGWGQLRAPGYLWEGPGLPGPAGPEAEDALMQGAYQAFPKGSKLPKPVPITVTFGPPFFLEEYVPHSEKMNADIQQEAMQVIMGKIAGLCGQQDAFPLKKPIKLSKEIE